jgi:hypothetical protein
VSTVEHKINLDTLVESIKSHVKRHQVLYSIGAGFGIAGITSLILKGCYTGVLRVPESSVPRVLDGPVKVTVTPFSLLSNRMTNNIVNVVHREGRGHPGYPVFDLDENILYMTQGLAAKALKTSDSIVSGHLKGKLPDVNGHHLVHVANPFFV